MKNYTAFSLAEIMVALFVLGVLASLTIPSMVTGANEKLYTRSYMKAYSTVSNIIANYMGSDEALLSSDDESIVQFTKYFIENTSVRELYAESNPNEKSETYSALKFGKNVIAGAKDPINVSSRININSKPNFWFVTDDNIAYSVVIPNGAKCSETLNINTAKNLNSALKASCFAVVVDTNGLFKNPNTLDETQDIANEKYIPNLVNDRYYIIIGSDGATKGNPNHILTAKVFNSK